MGHKAKKKIEENMAADNSHQEFLEPDSQTAEEAARYIAAETPGNAATEAGMLERNHVVDSTLIEEELRQEKDRYLRLYAEFDNYKKRIARDKEELIKYGNESLLYELLPVIDNLEMAMKHSSNDASAGLAQGVEITLKEFLRVIDKFGLSPIEASGKMFDPSLHHAMTQVERDDIDENMVVEEFRKGYMFSEKVLRPSLVSVSKKTVRSDSAGEETLKLNADTGTK